MEAVAFAAMPVKVAHFRARSVLRRVSGEPTCSRCKLREGCLSSGLEADEMIDLEEIVAAPMRVAKGETLYRSGSRFTGLYAIRLGSFKSSSRTTDTSRLPATTCPDAGYDEC